MQEKGTKESREEEDALQKIRKEEHRQDNGAEEKVHAKINIMIARMTEDASARKDTQMNASARGRNKRNIWGREVHCGRLKEEHRQDNGAEKENCVRSHIMMAKITGEPQWEARKRMRMQEEGTKGRGGEEKRTAEH